MSRPAAAAGRLDPAAAGTTFPAVYAAGLPATGAAAAAATLQSTGTLGAHQQYTYVPPPPPPSFLNSVFLLYVLCPTEKSVPYFSNSAKQRNVIAI